MSRKKFIKKNILFTPPGFEHGSPALRPYTKLAELCLLLMMKFMRFRFLLLYIMPIFKILIALLFLLTVQPLQTNR